MIEPRRVLGPLALGVVALAVFVAFAQGRADAMVEFCPASVLGYHAVPEPGEAKASRIYGYKIGALSKRSVTGTLAIETDKGWFTAPYAVSLEPETHTFESVMQKFQRTDFAAPTQFVRFPASVVVERMWVVDGAAKGDGPFGWEARGNVSCDPPGAALAQDFGDGWSAPDPEERAPAGAGAPFAAAADAVPASAVDPPAGLDCAKPFVPARVTSIAQAEWPEDLGTDGMKASTSTILEIALDARGYVKDVWIWGPSPYPELSYSAIAAAKKSSYSPAIALCRPVATVMLFRYDWSFESEAPPAPGR